MAAEAQPESAAFTGPHAAPPTASTAPATATPPALTHPSITTFSSSNSTQDRTDAWAKLIADPGHAPELLALAAVQTFGPPARGWAARIRASYPTADSDALARLAVRQFTRFGSLSSIFGAVAGSYAPLALVGAAAITHAELVLHVAAAYGLDPADPQRAADLLVIARVHPETADAEAALAAARRPVYEDGGLSGAVWRFGRMVAAQGGAWALVRLTSRYFPGTALLTAALSGNASAQSTAARAIAHYRRSTATDRPKPTAG